MTERRSVTVETLAHAIHDHTLHNGIGGVDDALAKSACVQFGWEQSRCMGKARAIFAALPAEPTEPAGALDVDLVRLAGFRDRLLIRDAEQPRGIVRELNPEEWATLIRASVALLPTAERLDVDYWKGFSDGRAAEAQGRLAPSEPRADSEGLRERLHAFLNDEGNHVGGVWGDYGEIVVSVGMVRDVIEGRITPPETDEDSAYTNRDRAARREQPAAEQDREVEG